MVPAADLVRRVQSRVGTTVGGKWKISRVLGIGGMATVYAATHRNQNRVAIKMLHPEQSLDEMVRSRFLREGYVANSVEHPGAVRVQDDDVTEDGAAFLVMELLEGETLEDRRERLGGRLPAADVLVLADQLLSVLDAAHEKGIVHRDIKPDNLFLTTRGELKVLDFGIAHLRELSERGGGTSAGTFMGTPSFMPPEQARARWDEVDTRSDLWAVGAVLFTLLSGRPVREAETVSEQLVQAVRDAAPPLGSVTSDVPRAIVAIVDRALAYAKEERFQSAREMRAAIRSALQELGSLEATGPSGHAEPSLAAFAKQSRSEVGETGDTMLAPSDGSSARQSELQDPAKPAGPSTLLSADVPQATPSPRRWRKVTALAALAVAVAAVAVVRQRGQPASSAAASADKLEPPPQGAGTPETAPAEARVTAAPITAPLHSAVTASLPMLGATSPSAESATPVTSARSSATPRSSKTTIAPSTSASSAAPAASSVRKDGARTADPFDKRF